MELNLARIVYVPAPPPPDTKPVLQRTQVTLPNSLANPDEQDALTAIEESVAREGYMVQVIA